MTFPGNIVLIFFCVLNGVNNEGDAHFAIIREASLKIQRRKAELKELQRYLAKTLIKQQLKTYLIAGLFCISLYSLNQF